MLDRAIETGLCTAAAAVRLGGRGPTETWVAGEGVTAETRFDVASLTKVMACAPVALAALGDRLDTDLRELIPGYRHEGITPRRLLCHDSGLPAYRHWIGEELAPNEVRRRLLNLPPEAGPGERTVYCCIGFVTLQVAIERVTGRTLDDLAREIVFAPLVLQNTGFLPDPEERHAIPPTESLDQRSVAESTQPGRGKAEIRAGRSGEVIQGVVHDPLAFSLGGVSGNAGLFTSIDDVATFAQAALEGTGPFAGDLAHEATRRQAPLFERGLGWNMATTDIRELPEFGTLATYGHTGFTGCAIWIDPEIGRAAALLTNRTFTGAPVERIKALRREFFGWALA